MPEGIYIHDKKATGPFFLKEATCFIDIRSDIQFCHQKLSGAFDLLLIFLCSLIQTLTPPLTMQCWQTRTCEDFSDEDKSILCLYSNTATPNPGACLLKVKPHPTTLQSGMFTCQTATVLLSFAGCYDAVVSYFSLSRYLLSPGMYPPKVCGPC